MIDPWLLDHLVCPRCRTRVELRDGWLHCSGAHRYPVVDDIPIMVLGDVEATHWAVTHALEHFRDAVPQPNALPADGVDPVVQEAIGATCGNLYRHLIGHMPRYPIPHLAFDGPEGAAFLDVGCHWGRWCVSAARKGWRVIGIDPYLPGVQAAKRVATQLCVDAHFVVADGRYLPFETSTFDLVHSYSVLQHFSEADVEMCAFEIGRVLRPGGRSHVQMAQRFGVLNVLQQARRRFRKPRLFQVRYWPLSALRSVFSSAIGPTTLSVDGFFSINVQSADLDLLRPLHRVLVRASMFLRRLATRLPWLILGADSVYVNSRSSRT
jgi:SAM-dependent methyltransferase